MDPTDIAFLKGAIAFVLLAGAGLSAVGLWLRARPRRLPQLEDQPPV